MAEEFDVEANGITPDLVFASSNDRFFWWRCPIEPAHHRWQAQPNNRLSGSTGCPDCTMPGTSAQQIRLSHELASVLDFPTHQHRIDLGAQGRVDVDIRIDALQLVIEFDGSYWHANTVARDRAKSEKLRSSGWKAVRVREKPLDLLDPFYDIPAHTLAPPFEAASIVLQHLESLGLLHGGDVADYVNGGGPRAVAAAEAELDRVRSRAAKPRCL
ncbi:zinc-ribbon domain-containing protein [Terrabacter sp. RAF57]|uniref:zinc-ribbon domain-containing protein n=1 Tax=Terrabacter sp. RAF57 TaxID=3233063 RepID=UPI003F9BEDF9